MYPLYTRGLSPDDFADGRWQTSAESLVIRILGNVLAVFQPIENGVVIAAQCNLGVDPGTMQRALSRSGDFFLRFAEPGKFRLQFLGEFFSLRADLDKKGFQICPLYLLRGFLKAVLPVPAPFDQMFHYVDNIVLVHLNLPRFDAGLPLRFGTILVCELMWELEAKGSRALKSSRTSMTKRKSKGAYMISPVAEMSGTHPHPLRLYEREGLLKPSRTEGNTRLYTDEDLERLEFILSLARDLGVNIAGMAIILQMRERMEEMQRQIQEFVQYIQQEVLTRANAAADPSKGAIVPVRRSIVPAAAVPNKEKRR
jgi:MerR family transcriptional regulator/heat shock protein HspR